MGDLSFWSVLHDHKDVIHDVAYDFYGRRIATCSSDQSVKVWDISASGEWTCTASWRFHSGGVWRVHWAHPEFGQVLATCSFDRTAAVWQEITAGGASASGAGGGGGQLSAALAARPTHWVRKGHLVDSRSDVTDVKFAPHHLGLVLATCSANGVVRVYEAPDVMNLHVWHLQHEMDTGRSMHRQRLRCRALAWSTSRMHPQLLLVGCDEPKLPQGAGSQIAVYERAPDARSWQRLDVLADFADPVFDAQFAPALGRSYHLLAVASRKVHLYAVKPGTGNDGGGGSQPGGGHTGSVGGGSAGGGGNPTGSTYDCAPLASVDCHGGQAWRVSWNCTGTLLASSGADGQVCLIKGGPTRQWSVAKVIKPDDSSSALRAHNPPNEALNFGY